MVLIDGEERPLPSEAEIERWVEVQGRMLGDGYPEFREADDAAGVEMPS